MIEKGSQTRFRINAIKLVVGHADYNLTALDMIKIDRGVGVRIFV